jgi:PKD repeat protein
VADAAGCQATDAIQVTVLPAPGANAGLDQTICMGNGVAQLAGTPSGGVWTGAGVASNGLFTPTSEGASTLTYTYTGSNSCTTSDQMTITVTNPNPPSGGPDVSVCLNSPPFQLPQVGTWNGSTLVTPGGVFTPSQVGTYNLFVTTSSGGCTASDMVVVNVMALPTVNAGADQAICIGQSVNLQATASSTNGGISGIAWTGGWVSNATILNPNANPTTYTNYTLLITDAAGCINNDVVSVTVNPIPTVQAGLDQSICSNAGLTQMTGATPSGGTWSGPGITSSGIFTPGVIGQYTMTYNYSSSSGCQSSDAKVITVITPGSVNAGPDLTLCQGGPTVLLQGGGTWSGSPFVQANGVFNPSNSGAYTLTYTANAGGCAAQDQITITVIGLPTVNAGSDAAICANQNYSLNATATSPNGAITSIQWTGLNVSNTALLNTLVSPTATSTYELTVQDAAGCVASDQISLTVNPLPIVYAGQDVTLCNQPSPYSLTDFAPNGGTWSGTGVTSNGVFTPSAIGTFVLNYCVTGLNGCQTCDQLSVFVNAVPANNAGPDVQLCQNSGSIQLNPVIGGGTWTGPGVSASGLFTPSSFNSYTLGYTIGSGFCQVTDQIIVTINSNPIASLPNQFDVCEGNSVHLNTVTTGGLPPYSYQWDVSDDDADEVLSNNQIANPIATPEEDITLIVDVSDARGCHATASTSLHVTASPEANFEMPQVACQNTPVAFENNSSSATNFQWSFGNSETSSASNPTVDYNLPGIYQVQLTAFNSAGCAHTSTQSIQITSLPTASFSMNVSEGCSPLSVTLNNQSAGADLAYQWTINGSFYNTVSPSNVVLTTEEVISIQPIALTVTNQCGTDSETMQVTIHPKPTAMFATDLSSQCSPVTTQYMNLSAGNPTSYQWNLGDGQTTSATTPENNVYITGEESADFVIQLIAVNACGVDSMSSTVHVLPNTVSMNLQPSVTSGCSPLFVHFNNQTTGANNFYYDYGNSDFAIAQNPNYVFQNAGNHLVRLTADDGCSYDTTEVMITVLPSPTLVLGADAISGCPGSTMHFDEATTGNITNIQWNFGDGAQANGTSPSHQFDLPSTYFVNATAYDFNGCSASAGLGITIHELPIPEIILQNTEACSPWQVCPENTSINAESYVWTSGTGSTSNDVLPCFTYVNSSDAPLTRTITLTATSEHGCTASTTSEISVLPQPQLVMALDHNESCLAQQTIQTSVFANATDNYQWYVNGAPVSNDTEPSFQFDNVGEYDIHLVVFNGFGCINEASSLYEIHPLPIIDIMPETMNGCPPLTINFDNTTEEGASWDWSFSNGASSNEMFPTVVFQHTGMYDVQLIATSEHGCQSTSHFEDMIEVFGTPVSNFTFLPNDEVLYELDVAFINTSLGALQYQWNFGDDAYSTLTSPVHEYTGGGFYTVTLTAQNEFGCTDKHVEAIQIDNTFFTFMPNAFTPDGDGINDTFGPVFSNQEDILSYRFYVKNKWGEIIFETDNPELKWRGNNNNEGYYLHTDVFTWVVELAFNNKTLNKIHEGTVTLIR